VHLKRLSKQKTGHSFATLCRSFIIIQGECGYTLKGLDRAAQLRCDSFLLCSSSLSTFQARGTSDRRCVAFVTQFLDEGVRFHVNLLMNCSGRFSLPGSEEEGSAAALHSPLDYMGTVWQMVSDSVANRVEFFFSLVGNYPRSHRKIGDVSRG
jgi:hypothetical protein